MANQGRGVRLRGRREECATLRALVGAADPDSGRVLVIRGEAGVGKTALLDYVHRQATDFQCARVAGVESDMELAFAGLHQLCAPLLTHLDELPSPQRDALSVAFGRGAGPAPDRFLVGLAVLSLMSAAARSTPLLCVVDDAQWLDQVSVQTLGFVARRLLAEPVVMVFAVRDNADVLSGLPEMFVTGLPDGDARKLLESVVLGRIDDRVRDRILAETRGNPLALLQVPRNVSAAELAGGFGYTIARPSAGHIEEGFVRRIRSLPVKTRRLLLVAAAEPVGDPSLFLRAAEKLGIAVDELAPAEAAEVIEFGSRMRFHHPLARSATYRTADLTERREVHRVLADATDPELDPDRRAWHAAIAATGPDDAVADDLEASAWRAERRGGIAAAATFLEHAAILTSEPVKRGSRAIAAAQAKRDAAAPDSASELLAIADLQPLSDLQRAQVARLRAQMEFSRSRGDEPGASQISQAAAQLRSAAERLETLDGELSRETYLEALAAAMYASARCGDPGLLMSTAEGARRAVSRLDTLDHPADHLLSGLATLLVGGRREGADHLRTALRMWCARAGERDGQDLRWLSLAFPIVHECCAAELYDDGLTHELADVMVRYARDVGALAVLPAALSYRAGIHVIAGEFNTAATLLDESDAISAAINYRPVKYHRLHLAAWRGVPADALALIEPATKEATAKGEGRLLGLAGYASALLYNGLGRYQEAFQAARRTCEEVDLGFHGWCLVELIESAARIDELDEAASALHRLEERAADTGTEWGLGALAGAKALLADDEYADALFTEAIARLDQTRVAVHAARTRLCYGEWLRRRNRRPDARTQLGDAHEMFTRFGAQAYAERARRELTAAGEKVRTQPDGTGGELTAQETQIARLAAEGFTNQEIGAQLFISAHTAEWHLRKVFVKLGITSRRQLRSISWAS
ncbi:ATP-binding protein [Mycolicibacterium austroafricanum]|uniref:ATP-binding protein n=1 Tax=Mycolicibacterium austroafricanum TaxID=39687 RepID=UPI000CF9E817|nr:LuxR family transcriptional regulator [Mycolicibacterium austroafricanum]PQP41257.1 LuxR family transcriptional regulator [Mycolicibacterium austroafricanum]